MQDTTRTPTPESTNDIETILGHLDPIVRLLVALAFSGLIAVLKLGGDLGGLSWLWVFVPQLFLVGWWWQVRRMGRDRL